jgi:putative endonuclease
VGLTDNVDRPINEHNKGYNKTTKPCVPFKLIISDFFPDRPTARLREKYLKSGVGKEYLKKLLREL